MDLMCKSSRQTSILKEMPALRGLPILRNLPKPRGFPILRNLPKPRGLPINKFLPGLGKTVRSGGYLPKPRGLPIPKFFPGLGKNVRSGGCSSGYTITLDAKGIEYQPDTAGDYLEVCSADGIPVYR